MEIYEFELIKISTLKLLMEIYACVLSVNVYVPKDRVTNLHQGYGFVEFRSEEDADYVSLHICNCSIASNSMLKLFGPKCNLVNLFSNL